VSGPVTPGPGVPVGPGHEADASPPRGSPDAPAEAVVGDEHLLAIPVTAGEPDGSERPEGDGIPPARSGDGPPVSDEAEDGRPDAAVELTEAQLEALLFVAERPLSRREIVAATGSDRATVDARLGDLEIALRDRGIRLLLDGDRVELATAPEAGAIIARYVGADAVRLTPAALETLAIVAYRQPVTKAAVERIRGVDSDYTIRTLLHRRLVVELGRADAPGRPFLYGTGFDFLERFGLTSLEELPPLEVGVAARLAEEGGDAATAPDTIRGLGPPGPTTRRTGAGEPDMLRPLDPETALGRGPTDDGGPTDDTDGGPTDEPDGGPASPSR
jgi:segregation and condensation protein B